MNFKARIFQHETSYFLDYKTLMSFFETIAGAMGTDVSLTRAIKRDNRPNMVTSPSSSSASPSSSPPAGCSNLAPSYQPTVAAFRCDVCSITVTSITQLTQHQAGLKHLKKVQKESRLDAG